MVCGTFTESKVPKNDLQHRIDMWKISGATQVTSAEDDDGTYTITAIFPPCPDNTTHDTGGKISASAGG